MIPLKLLAILFGVSLVLLSSSVSAGEWNKKTLITFSGRVQVANTPLPGGICVFKMADTTDRHPLQIFNRDEAHVIATIMAIPDYRVEPADNTVIKFAETSEGSEVSGTLPESGIPIEEWFYSGNNSGQEFQFVSHPQVAAVQPEPAVEPAATPVAPAESPEAAASPEPQAESSR